MRDKLPFRKEIMNYNKKAKEWIAAQLGKNNTKRMQRILTLFITDANKGVLTAVEVLTNGSPSFTRRRKKQKDIEKGLKT